MGFQLQCEEVIHELSFHAYDLADHCLQTMSECVKERACTILDKWEETYNKITSTPENEIELKELKDFMAIADKTIAKPLMVKTREVHNQMNMVDSFFYEIEPEVVLK